jgi:hypothetical protein
VKQILLAFGVLLLAVLACSPATTSKDATAAVTTFVDESGSGEIPESYTPLPDTLVIATWNVHGYMSRDVQLTDQSGRANFPVTYTHYLTSVYFLPAATIPPRHFIKT